MNPAEWSLANGARIEPVQWEVAARALRQAEIPTYELSWTHLVRHYHRWNRERWDAEQKTFTRSGWIANAEIVSVETMFNPGEQKILVKYFLGIDGGVIDGSGNRVTPPPMADLQALVFLSKYGSGTLPFPQLSALQYQLGDAPDAYYIGLNSVHNGTPQWLGLIYKRRSTPYISAPSPG
jgi:hypothetical protein